MYGTRKLEKGAQGEDVVELQIRLSGFFGGVPDGDFGPGSDKSVRQFQTDYMRIESTGIVDRATFLAIDEFANKFPIDFENPEMLCPCGVCGGFGQGLRRGEYRDGKPKIEVYYNYEYPGIHRGILWAARALFFYNPDYNFTFNSGYRCSVRNRQKGRSSTNHHGKAIDLDVPNANGEDKQDDIKRCNELRAQAVEKSNAQIGWAANNKKALEPADIAPTWVHYDVRCYASQYLEDKFFCKTLDELDRRVEIMVDKPVEVGLAEEAVTEILESPPVEVIKEPEHKETKKDAGTMGLVMDLLNMILGMFGKKR